VGVPDEAVGILWCGMVLLGEVEARICAVKDVRDP